MKTMRLLLATFLSAVCLASCGGNDKYGSGKTRSRFSDNIEKAYIERGAQDYYNKIGNTPAALLKTRTNMDLFYGENKEITDENYSHALAVNTPYGTYVGKAEAQSVVSWKGIPYAKAPVNELRWKAPQQLDKSRKVYEAYHFGHTAVQQEAIDEPSSLYRQGEDCLNLNIWNNFEDQNSKKPVMVWIHGGAYILGGTSETQYDGGNFVTYNPDVIYVSIDYRVDMLGFINLTQVPGGDKYAESANLGLLDEVAALYWIQENIAAFGGDPDRVTIFGESAGGGSCSALTVMPQAKGLFKRAIIQSGSATNLLRTKEKSIKQTNDILEITGCKNMDDLLELTPEDIRKLAIIRGLEGPASYTFPELDGVVLKKNLRELLETDVRDGIDILSGTTEDEYEYWTKVLTQPINAAAMDKALTEFRGKLDGEQRARYDLFRSKIPGDKYHVDVETVSYNSFHAPCRYEASTHSKRGNKVYQYFFTEKAKQFGAYHAFELGFLFGNFSKDINCSPIEAFRLSIIMQRMWVNFASKGDPSIPEGEILGVGAIPWETYDSNSKKVMIINSEIDQVHTVKDPLSDNIDLIGDLFWEKLK